jgi:WD40 repeat protein
LGPSVSGHAGVFAGVYVFTTGVHVFTTGASVVVVAAGGSLHGLDSRSQDEAFRVSKVHSSAPIRDLDFSPSTPKLVASAGGDGSIRQTDLRYAKRALHLP